MTLFQQFWIGSAVVLFPFSLYVGKSIAWLFGNFLPGPNETNASDHSLALWRGLWIAAALVAMSALLAWIATSIVGTG